MTASQYQQVDWTAEKFCPVCSSPLPKAVSRPFIYCKEACKKKALRARQKTSLISSENQKTSRISKKTSRNSPPVEKFIGVSGTVHRVKPSAESAAKRPAMSGTPTPIRNFDDLKKLLGG